MPIPETTLPDRGWNILFAAHAKLFPTSPFSGRRDRDLNLFTKGGKK
jgi:hypothetical protein